MKLNQKILKAINEGIYKSLISFNDVDFDKTNSTNTNQKVTKSIKDWKWIQDNFVDLGLPSGTLWCKWNIGATNGNTPESWYGAYYAWGEIKIKSKYTLGEYTYQENPNILPDGKDVAYLTNNLMHMPFTQQIQELDDETEHHWVENYNGINGLNGQLFTGKNGNTLFIPAAGYRSQSDCYYAGSDCYLWSRSLNFNSPIVAYCLYFDISNFYSFTDHIRYSGQSVRGVL